MVVSSDWNENGQVCDCFLIHELQPMDRLDGGTWKEHGKKISEKDNQGRSLQTDV